MTQHSYRTLGVCSRAISFELDDDKRVHNVMYIVADMVRAAVPHIFADFIVARKQSELFELLIAVAAGGLIHIVHQHARLDDGEHVI